MPMDQQSTTPSICTRSIDLIGTFSLLLQRASDRVPVSVCRSTRRIRGRLHTLSVSSASCDLLLADHRVRRDEWGAPLALSDGRQAALLRYWQRVWLAA